MSKVTFTITVDVPIAAIEKSVNAYIVDCFKRPQYSNDGTIGWQEVKRQVKAYIEALDLKPMIEAELQPVIKRVASEIIAGEMSREIKGIIRKRMSEGRFLNVYAALDAAGVAE